MRKPICDMSEREMLAELLAAQRREEDLRRLGLGLRLLLLAAVAALLIIYLPPVIRYFRDLSASIRQLQEGIQQVQNTVTGVKESLSGLGASGLEALQRAAEKLNELLDNLPPIFRK